MSAGRVGQVGPVGQVGQPDNRRLHYGWQRG